MKHRHEPRPLSAMLTSLPLDLEAALRQARTLGFTHVDVVGLHERPEAHLEALAETGLFVSCIALGRALPEGCTLDAAALDQRRTALEQVRRQVADAARMGASHCYVIPGLDASAPGLARFAEACTLLADFAGERMVRLCVEHIPARALPTAAGTLAWLAQLGHPNLSLLMDVGHCLISREDPAHIVAESGALLGYVHFDDNDGVGDLHLPLLTGCLTRALLAATVAALVRADYRAAFALELRPDSADPVAALAEGKALLERLLAENQAPEHDG